MQLSDLWASINAVKYVQQKALGLSSPSLRIQRAGKKGKLFCEVLKCGTGTWPGKNINNSIKQQWLQRQMQHSHSRTSLLKNSKDSRSYEVQISAGKQLGLYKHSRRRNCCLHIHQQNKTASASFQGFSRPSQHLYLLLKGQSSEWAQIFWSTVTEFVCTTAKARLHLWE